MAIKAIFYIISVSRQRRKNFIDKTRRDVWKVEKVFQLYDKPVWNVL